jgi:hypothetical protein
MISRMNLSLMAFMMMAGASVLFLTALLVGEEQFKVAPVRQTGDSSLGRQSVNWLGGLALLTAVLICLV